MLNHHVKKGSAQPRCRGFSLIELSIALIIIGLIIVPVMKAYTVYRVQKARDDTYANRTLVEAALGDYYLKNGNYPCPALRNVNSDDPRYGVSVACTPGALPAIGACLGGAGGVCRTTGSTTRANPDYDAITNPSVPTTLPINPNILIGGIPFVTLGIPAEMAVDGWSRTMTYAVTESMADTTDADANGIPDNFERNSGAIQVKSFLGDDYAAGTATYISVPDYQNLHIFLASSGDDGAGAYTLEGALYKACAAGHADSENCDGDGVFFDSLASGDLRVGYGTASDPLIPASLLFHDDDIVMEITDVPTGIWTYSRARPQDAITFKKVGVGIQDVSANLNPDGSVRLSSSGSMTFDNSIVLDVKDTIGATRVSVDQICDLTGANCFPAAALGSVGDNPDRIQCPGGVTMTGIANGGAVCTPKFPLSMASQSCPPGEYIRGFIAGVIQCAAP